MTKKHEQPSEAQEMANAAFVWRKKVQADLIERMRSVDIDLETAEFWFERFRRAYLRERDFLTAEKAERERPQTAALDESEPGEHQEVLDAIEACNTGECE